MQVETETAPWFEIQGADAVVDIDEEKAWPAPSLVFDEDTITDILSKNQKNQTEDEKTLLRKFQVKKAFNLQKGLDAFGNKIGWEVVEGWVDTTWLDAQAAESIKKIEAESRTALTDKEADVALRLTQAKSDITERGEQRMNTLDRGLSFSGFGRSSTAIDKRDNVQKSINNEIRIAQSKADLEIQLFKAQQAGADATAISGISKNLADTVKLLKETEAENAKATAELSMELWLSSDEALNALLEGTAQGLQAKDKWFDKDASLALGYVSDAFGNELVTDADGNPIAFSSDELWSDVKISNFKDGNDNTYVYKNGVLSSIIQNDGTILTGDEVKTAKVPWSVIEDKKDKTRRDIETQLRKEFNWRDEIKKFNKIRSEFSRIQKASQTQNFETGIADVALVFAYMKMLDPTSVVRESEFATAQNSAGVPEGIRNAFNKANSWQFLSKTQRSDILNLSKSLFQSEKDVVNSVIKQTQAIAEDAGARWEFIIGDFDAGVDKPEGIQLDEDETAELDTLFPESKVEWPSDNTFKAWKSWKQFKINFSTAESTAWTNDLSTSEFTEKLDIKRTWTNVAKDTNNPWNITADSIPSWFTKKEYWERIWASGTYLSPNGREYFVFDSVDSWSKALQADLQAKISWNSRNIKPSDTLERFQRVYVWEVSPWYLSVLERITWKGKNTPIKDIDAKLLTQAVMEAEWFTN